MDLIERLRSVNWEVVEDFPDHPAFKCVFVDMRPDDFRALLREAADALEVALEDADAWKDAVDHELTALHSTADSFTNPREAVRALIDWHISVERDPAVSEMARDAARWRAQHQETGDAD